MSHNPWDKELASEDPSLALLDAFATSAERLAHDLSEEWLEILERNYLNPNFSSEAPRDTVVAQLVDAGLRIDPSAALGLLEQAHGIHRSPFLAIAAQALMFGDPDHQQRAAAIFEELASEAKFAEAAVLLAYAGDSLPSGTHRPEYWRDQAKALWPSKLRTMGSNVRRFTPFGSYYVAHVLAARAASARPRGDASPSN